ncbi:MAG: hypothetical protein ABFD13_06270 [Candidatus Cryosericum sp.]|nr:hypothetical protein [bacterium]
MRRILVVLLIIVLVVLVVVLLLSGATFRQTSSADPPVSVRYAAPTTTLMLDQEGVGAQHRHQLTLNPVQRQCLRHTALTAGSEWLCLLSVVSAQALQFSMRL